MLLHLACLFAVEVRRSLHLRLGLPLDRPLLRIANSVNLFVRDTMKENSVHKGNCLLCTRMYFVLFIVIIIL